MMKKLVISVDFSCLFCSFIDSIINILCIKLIYVFVIIICLRYFLKIFVNEWICFKGVNFQKQNFKENSSTSQHQSKDSGSKFELDDDDSEDDDESKCYEYFAYKI